MVNGATRVEAYAPERTWPVDRLGRDEGRAGDDLPPCQHLDLAQPLPLVDRQGHFDGGDDALDERAVILDDP